jgi:hypothetical protein
MSGMLQHGAMPTLEARLACRPRRVLDVLRQHHRLRKAGKAVPKPMPWEWARPRLMPLLAGPYLGPDRLVTTIAALGCAVTYGVEVKKTYLIVDHSVMERWECSVPQLAEVATSNLERRAARLSPADIHHGVLAGHITRVLDRVSWASSLVLAPNHLVRLFGGEDQVFGTPRREVLLGWSIDTPGRVAAHITVNFEANAAYPLLLDPFVLIDGELVWQDLPDELPPD